MEAAAASTPLAAASDASPALFLVATGESLALGHVAVCSALVLLHRARRALDRCVQTRRSARSTSCSNARRLTSAAAPGSGWTRRCSRPRVCWWSPRCGARCWRVGSRLSVPDAVCSPRLPCKTCERPRMLRSVANAAHAHMNATLEPLGAGSVRPRLAPLLSLLSLSLSCGRRSDPTVRVADQRYRSLKEALVNAEQSVLRALAFDVDAALPFSLLLGLARAFGCVRRLQQRQQSPETHVWWWWWWWPRQVLARDGRVRAAAGERRAAGRRGARRAAAGAGRRQSAARVAGHGGQRSRRGVRQVVVRLRRQVGASPPSPPLVRAWAC
jgi:hypothetical protein